jgi:hypothetical protein
VDASYGVCEAVFTRKQAVDCPKEVLRGGNYLNDGKKSTSDTTTGKERLSKSIVKKELRVVALSAET